MADTNPYPTPGGVEAAIKEAAKKASTADPSLTINEHIRMAHYVGFSTVELATDLVARFIDPALDDSASSRPWSHQRLDWYAE